MNPSTSRIWQAHKRPFLFVLLLLATAAAGRAQFFGAPLEIHYVTSNPSGACSAQYITINTTTGTIRGCVGGVWTTLGGGSSTGWHCNSADTLCAWQATTAYSQYEIAFYQQTYWLAIQAGTNKQPDSRANIYVYWVPLGPAETWTTNLTMGTGTNYYIDPLVADRNVALGNNAMGGSSTPGSSNVAVGASTIRNMNNGTQNTAIGYQALYDTTSGANNVAAGVAAGMGNVTGSNNTHIGAGATNLGTNHHHQTVIGSDASADCDSCVTLGRSTDTVIIPGALITAPVANTALNTGNFWVVRTSTSVLTIGPSCSTAPNDCALSYGSLSATLTASATATITSGTSDTAYVYIDGSTLKVGTNTAGITCSGCTAVTGITAFPANTIPLWTWTIVGGLWTAGGVGNVTYNYKGSGQLHGITFALDGGGAVLSTGDIGHYSAVPSAANAGGFSCSITGVSLTGSPSGSVTVEVWKKNGGIPTSVDKISASAPITLASTQTQLNGSIAGWSKNVSPGDVFAFNITAAATTTKINGVIWCQ